MKKIFYLVAAAALIVSCSKDVENELVQEDVQEAAALLRADVDPRVNATLTMTNYTNRNVWFLYSLDPFIFQFTNGSFVTEPETLAGWNPILGGSLITNVYGESKTWVLYNNEGFSFAGQTLAYMRIPFYSVTEFDYGQDFYYKVTIKVKGKGADAVPNVIEYTSEGRIYDLNFDITNFGTSSDPSGSWQINVEIQIDAYEI
ncbi:MAG: hypothetical protein LUF90_00575 [Rikenellaceae bacterium]|nr:hypothetical protein [Rikenellaceae bacterium]